MSAHSKETPLGGEGLIRRRREIDGQTELIMRKSIKRRGSVGFIRPSRRLESAEERRGAAGAYLCAWSLRDTPADHLANRCAAALTYTVWKRLCVVSHRAHHRHDSWRSPQNHQIPPILWPAVDFVYAQSCSDPHPSVCCGFVQLCFPHTHLFPFWPLLFLKYERDQILFRACMSHLD